MKTNTPSLILISLLTGLALLQPAHAVVPPPDGGYPGFNTAEGQNALSSLTTGTGNAAVGAFSLFSNTTASFNTAVGAGALLFNVESQNTAVGALAMFNNTTGMKNTANGVQALSKNTTGFVNTANGVQALYNNTTGGGNTANGFGALISNTIGGSNTANGFNALVANTTGGGNTAIGTSAGTNVSTADHVICIGADVAGADVSNTTWIGGVYGVTTQSGTTAPVVVSDTGQLGTAASSERFKKDIANMDKASEAVLSLRPVTFHYKSDAKETPQFGLIAEEVAKMNPALVLPDKEGKPYTVRYEAVNAMLLNEFLKEHRTVQELKSKVAKQEDTIAQQQKGIEVLTASLKEQASQIQKVSAQLEVTKPTPQMVLNNQ
jgi:uncharacterized coiled-coil protein SlyX